ncbi:MAG: 50S ribosomal protein L11 methyltransferase [Candidatus Gracilibacteria bacterium]
MKSKTTFNKIVDFVTFFILSIAVVAIVALATQTFQSPWAIALAILITIPTIIAMSTGAPFVPTPMPRVEKMLALAKVKPNEKVYDIGCGDGRMVYVAANQYGANATGFELSPLVYCLAKIRKFFWKSKAKIEFTDFRYKNLGDADVIVCYLLPEALARLQSKLEAELKKGARVVSYAFPIGTWEVTHREERNRGQNLAPIWVYQR